MTAGARGQGAGELQGRQPALRAWRPASDRRRAPRSPAAASAAASPAWIAATSPSLPPPQQREARVWGVDAAKKEDEEAGLACVL